VHEATSPRSIQRDNGVQPRAGTGGKIRNRRILRDRSVSASVDKGKEAECSPLAGYHEAKRLLREGVDIITGGFPCQDISKAGKGAGIQYERATGEATTRSGLGGQLVRTIRLVRPRFAIMENVAALLGNGMGSVLGDLAEIGYDAEWHCISASHIEAPHDRQRIWIIANSNGIRAVGDEIQAGINRQSNQEWGADKSHIRSEVAGRDYRTIPISVRVDDGLPHGLDRVKGLGNAVIPQIPEIIGEAIASCL